MELNGPSRKRIKLESTQDSCNFSTFFGSLQPYIGSFRINVEQFLSQHAVAVTGGSNSRGLKMWCKRFFFQKSGRGMSDRPVVMLEILEEDVQFVPENRIHCRNCAVVGWGRHPVSAKRYHFLIQNNQDQSNRQSVLTYVEKPECWEDSDHLLHGVVHSNGFGHLVRINGIQGGSRFLTGSDLMGFWDCLCKVLGVRKVSVMDVSKKHEMEYRLLHAIIYGHPWYSKWDYIFGKGSFGLTFNIYKNALRKLSTEPLSLLFSNVRSPQSNLQNTIASYQFLSDKNLDTVRDLFRFISDILGRQRQEGKTKSFAQKHGSVKCLWSDDELRNSFDRMLQVLHAVSEEKWVSWKILKGATSRSIGSPKLVDYCLKHLAGKRKDGKTVVARPNEESHFIEYRLEAVQKDSHSAPEAQKYQPSREQILSDLLYLYKELLNPQTMHAYKPESRLQAARHAAIRLLDSKHLIKHYDQAHDIILTDSYVRRTCYIQVDDADEDPVCPPEILTLPISATGEDIKNEASKAFKETYLFYGKFEAEDLVELEETNSGSRKDVLIRGRCKEKIAKYKMERGIEKWTVNCACGEIDDDGEMMIICDVCHVWRHIRCSQIDEMFVPKKYVCSLCLSATRK
ncbi:PHD finger protein [Rhynchospora pubera]|uniref:PHD finger protein n=1 Tax=Rhynchospora pubera TaxID=906938 RepID=A0AAV8CA39_9POAL|nr:PHD finger protein [Rhynchospora pubera]